MSFVVGGGAPPGSLTISVVMMGGSGPFPGISSYDPSTSTATFVSSGPMTPGAYYLLTAMQAGVPFDSRVFNPGTFISPSP